MESFAVASYVKDLFVFLIVIFFGLYIPGSFLLSLFKLKLRTPEPFFIPTSLGLLFFIFVTYIFSWIHAPIFIHPIIFIINIYFFKHNRIPYTTTPSHRMPLLLCVFLAFIFALPMLGTGIYGTTAVYRTDDIIHLAYVNELINHFPPDNPGFSNAPLLGYHFFSDFLIAMITKVFFIRKEYLYFHFIPVLTALFWSVGTYSLVWTWLKNKFSSLLASFLVMFGGSWGFILWLLGHTQADISTPFGIDQPASALLNPPYALSVGIILTALFLAHEYMHSKKMGWVFLLAVTVGLSLMIKIYAGILLVLLFSIMVIFDLLKKQYFIIFPTILSIFIIVITYGVFSGSGGYLIYSPLWEIQKILTDSMPWYGYEEKMYTYGKFGMWHRIFMIQAYGVVLYLLGNLGTRLIGIALGIFFFIRKQLQYSTLFVPILIAQLFAALLIPLFFIQSIKVFEIIQFAWYAMFFGSLLAVFGISQFIYVVKLRFIQVVVCGIFIVLTLPSAIETFTFQVYPGTRRPTREFNKSLIDIYTYLLSDPDYDKTVLELPPINTPHTFENAIAWYRTTLPYIAAFGNKRSYFHSQNIDFPNIKTEGHIETLFAILRLETETASASAYTNEKSIYTRLKDEEVGYILSPFQLMYLPQNNTVALVVSTPPLFLYKVNNGDENKM